MSKPQGKVKFFDENRGFGFITPDEGGKDVFVHITAVKDSYYDKLEEGDVVEYEVVDGHKGKMAGKLKILN
jgi:cold shock protein